GQHTGGNLLCHVGLHLFLLLEAGVEEAPRGKRVGGLRLEEGGDQSSQRLGDRYEQGSCLNVGRLPTPRSRQLSSHPALEWSGRELNLLRTKRAGRDCSQSLL